MKFTFVQVLCDSSSILANIGAMAMFGLLKATSLGYKRKKSKDVDRSSHSKVIALSQKFCGEALQWTFWLH